MNAFQHPVRLAIVGSRGFADLGQVRDYVARLHPGCVVITGGARGVDAVAEEAARQRGLAVELFLPDWRRDGRRAGIVRNALIVEACEALVGSGTAAARVPATASSAPRPLGDPWR